MRERLELTGEAFARLLAEVARRRGWEAAYTKSKVSLMESERRDLSLEDVALLEDVDPDGRGWRWFAFGEARTGAVGVGARQRAQEILDRLGIRAPEPTLPAPDQATAPRKRGGASRRGGRGT